MTQQDTNSQVLLTDLAEHELPHDQTLAVAKLGSARGGWFRQVGWRHLVGIIALFFAIFPILFLISAALNPLGTLSSSTLIPNGASFDNFSKLWKTDYLHWLFNSVLIALLSSAISIFVAAAGAFAFSRFRFRGRRGGLLAILLVQMFPQFLAVVAIYLMFSGVSDLYPGLGFNTPWGLIILYLGGAMGGSVWLIKGFFDTVPKDLDESAKVDGATHPQIYFGIILPLITPILAVTGLLAFIGAINEIIFASVFLTNGPDKTAAVGLYGLVSGQRNTNFGVFAAGSIITAIPIVLLFQYLQRYIVGGLTAGAVKG